MRVFQVSEDLSKTIQFAGNVHKAIAFFLYDLDDLVCKYIEVGAQAPCGGLYLLQVHILLCFSTKVGDAELLQQLASVKSLFEEHLIHCFISQLGGDLDRLGELTLIRMQM